MKEAVIAAKRYRQYKAEKRNDLIQKTIISFLLRLFEAIAKALQKSRIIRRSNVETVKVE